MNDSNTAPHWSKASMPTVRSYMETQGPNIARVIEIKRSSRKVFISELTLRW